MIESSSKIQHFAAFCVNIITLAHGATVGWTSPSIPLLLSERSPIKTGPITNEQASYISALMCLGGLFGTFIFGFMSDKIGRKTSLIFLAFPQIGWWASVIFGTKVEHLYAGRIMAGLAAGGVFVLVPLYVAEISENRIRGQLGSLFILIHNLGVLLAFVAGNYLTYKLVGIIMITLPILFFFAFLFLPETPQYLIKRRKVKEAEKSLKFLRGYECTKDTPDFIKQEFSEIIKSSGSLKEEGSNDSICKTFSMSSGAKKGLIIGIVIICVSQLSGIFPLIIYTATIFKEAGSNLSPNMSAIIVAGIQLIGSYVSTITVDRVGRKILFIISCLGIFFGLAALGTHGLLKSKSYDVSEYFWVPVVSLSFVIFIAAIGILPLPFVIISEILPQRVRSFGVSVCTSIMWILAYLMLRYFVTLVTILNLYGCLFIFCGIVLNGMIFVIIFVPETKGKSIDSIVNTLSES